MSYPSRRIHLLDATANERPSEPKDTLTTLAPSRENIGPYTRSFRVFEGHSWKLVVVDVDRHGTRTYWEEEPGDVRRFSFTPKDRERQAIDEAVRGDRGKGYQGDVIDLDIYGHVMDRADSLSLGAFRRFIQTTCNVTVAVELDRRIVRFLLQLDTDKEVVNDRRRPK